MTGVLSSLKGIRKSGLLFQVINVHGFRCSDHHIAISHFQLTVVPKHTGRRIVKGAGFYDRLA